MTTTTGTPTGMGTGVSAADTRPASRTRRRRYPSDTTAAEWALIEPLLPPARTGPGRGRGRPEKHPRRAIVDAIRYLVDNGIKWRALPRDYPPWSTVYNHFAKWAAAGVVELIRDQLRRQIRLRSGKCAKPVAVIVDSQSVKAAETVSKADRGFDAAKKSTAGSGTSSWTRAA